MPTASLVKQYRMGRKAYAGEVGRERDSLEADERGFVRLGVPVIFDDSLHPEECLKIVEGRIW